MLRMEIVAVCSHIRKTNKYTLWAEWRNFNGKPHGISSHKALKGSDTN